MIYQTKLYIDELPSSVADHYFELTAELGQVLCRDCFKLFVRRDRSNSRQLLIELHCPPLTAAEKHIVISILRFGPEFEVRQVLEPLNTSSSLIE